MVIWWGLNTYRTYPLDSTSLQKWLMLLPVFKLICTFLYGNYVGLCPWPNQIQSRYLMMALVTTSAVYQTFLTFFILILSKGWKLARQRLQRADISNFTMMMGACYMLYSAYYISYNVSTLRFFIGFVINIMYLIQAMMVTQSTVDTLDDLREDLNLARAGNSF